jgi:uncharacterized protein (TIGR02757 family)
VTRGRRLSPARAAALRPLLERLAAEVDLAARLRADPVELPRRYPDAADAEVAGLVAACLAYGRADLFKPQLERVLAAMGPSPARFAAELARRPDPAPFAGFRYRFNQPADVAALVAAAGEVRARHGSLGARFAALFDAARRDADPLRAALAAFAAELRGSAAARAALGARPPRGLAHLLVDASLPGAAKRWNLYLRWMVRGPDGVDLGLWRGVPASALVVPLDTHVARLARHLALTDRADLGWRTAAEVTAALRAIDPDDPVRFDFALCHHGMSGACPVRRDPACCAACPLRGACRARARRAVSAAPPGPSPRPRPDSGSATARTS